MGVEVSPLHALRLKSAAAPVAPPFHVSAMFSEAQPRGIKRKAHSLDDFSDGGVDEEEDDEEDSSSSSSCSSASSTTGGGSSGDDARSYSRRHHVVFNMSLCKLARFRQAADPSLLRSVLVCNTLRALERDMRPPRGPEPALPASSPSSPHHSPHHHHHHSPHHHHLNGAAIGGGGHHLPPHQPYGAATPFHNGDDYDRSCPPGDNSGGRLTPFLRPEPASGPPPAPLWTEEDRLPSLNWSSVLNFGNGAAPVTPPAPSVAEPVSSACGGGEPGCGAAPAPLYTLLPAHNSPAAMVVTSSTSVAASAVLQTSSCSSSSSSSSVASSSGGSSSDEIFGDIDLSLYDFDLLSPLSPPHVKLAPVSAEDLMRSLAASQQQAADCVVTTTAASPSAATCQLVASSGQQVSFGYKGLMGCSAEDHVATVMS
ncbi:uncharacterized protein LOC144133213 [Amblyomma americanum]